MFKCKLKKAPKVFHHLYTLKPISKYNMRSNYYLVKPKSNSKFSQYALSYRAPSLWNKLIILQNPDAGNLMDHQNFKKTITKIVSNINNIQEHF